MGTQTQTQVEVRTELDRLNQEIENLRRELGEPLPEKPFEDRRKATQEISNLKLALVEKRGEDKKTRHLESQITTLPHEKYPCSGKCGRDIETGKWCPECKVLVDRWDRGLYVLRKSGEPIPTHPFLHAYNPKSETNIHKSVICPKCKRAWMTVGDNPHHPACWEEMKAALPKTALLAEESEPEKNPSDVMIDSALIDYPKRGERYGKMFFLLFPTKKEYAKWLTSPLVKEYRDKVKSRVVYHLMKHVEEIGLDSLGEISTQDAWDLISWDDFARKEIEKAELYKTIGSASKLEIEERVKQISESGGEQKPFRSNDTITTDLFALSKTLNDTGHDFDLKIKIGRVWYHVYSEPKND